MNSVKEQIELLAVLQEKDRVIEDLKKKMALCPVNIENEKNAILSLKNEFEAEKKLLQSCQLKKKEKEMDLDNNETSIKKHNTELNAVKSNEAYKALLSEIEKDKSAKNALEEEILMLMESIDVEAAKLKKREIELKAKEAGSLGNISKLEQEGKELQSQFDKLNAEREEFSPKIIQDILQRYDYIRESRDGIGLVMLEGESCGGCGTVLRPQTINDVIKCNELIFCDSCSRILRKK